MPSPVALPRLAPFRVHEVGGAGASAFAFAMARQASGPVLWIGPAHGTERLLPAGVACLLPCSRLIVVQAGDEADLLWSTEDALR